MSIEVILFVSLCILGIPIIKIIFNQSPQLSAISLPLLVYHPTQILLGGSLVSWLQSWVENQNDDGDEKSDSTPEIVTLSTEQDQMVSQLTDENPLL